MQIVPLAQHAKDPLHEARLTSMQNNKRENAAAVSFSRREVGDIKARLRMKNQVAGQVVRPKCFEKTLDSPAIGTRSADGASLPPPPPYLNDEIALREWHAIAPTLARRGLLDEGMRPLLAGYCSALARTVRAEQILLREGRYYKTITTGGSVMKRRHPAVQDAEEGWASVRQFARHLGLSASFVSSRSIKSGRSDFFK